MKYLSVPFSDRPVSQVALGCMRIASLSDAEADAYLNTALSLGYNYFDHADIYGGGRCEEVFGRALRRNPALRERMILQTKCGIKRGMYDFSKQHILASVDGSLARLGVEQIDVLLLHRPDLLMDPDEVAAAFDALEASGKVRAFGVSNHSPLQIALLQKSVKQPLRINQLQLSVVNAGMISNGANVNLANADGTNRDGYLRDYCRLHGITVQPWSPLQHGFISGPFLTNEQFAPVNRVIGELAAQYGVSATGMAIAWLLRLPDNMQPVVGTTNLPRMSEIAAASEIALDAADWYKIYLAAGYQLP